VGDLGVGGTCSGVGVLGGVRPVVGRLARGSLGCLLALLSALLIAGAAGAAAEPLCTDSWVGPSEGNWQTATSWSTGEVPTSTTVACIGVGKTVTVTEGTNQAGVLLDKGTLIVSGGGVFEVANALEASSVATLTMSAGALTGAGTLDVSSSLSWSGGSMVGSGSTVLEAGTSASITAPVSITERAFVNRGTLTFSAGFIFEARGARIENTGTFKDNSETSTFGAQILVYENSPAPSVVNTGTFEKTVGSGTGTVAVHFSNSATTEARSGQLAFVEEGTSSGGSFTATEGASIAFSGGPFSQSGGSWSGAIDVVGVTLTAEGVAGTNAQVTVSSGGTLSFGGTTTVKGLALTAGNLTGSGSLSVSNSFSWSGESKMSGSGRTVIEKGVTGLIEGPGASRLFISERRLSNEGVLDFSSGVILESNGARIENSGTFEDNSQATNYGTQQILVFENSPPPLFVNTGTFEKTEGVNEATVAVPFQNLGSIAEPTGKLVFTNPISPEQAAQWGGAENPSAPGMPHPTCGDPVSCATGNFSETQTDLSVGGRGVGLNLTRTYNSQAAAAEQHGAFGYGWTSSFGDRLVVEKASKIATVHQANGGTVPFTEASEGKFIAAPWTQDTLIGSTESGYTLTLADQVKFKFSGGSGRLESVTDRDGNATTLVYSEAGRLEAITDPAGRKITLAYNAEGLVESAKDPLGHTVKYTYEGGNLASVTQPGEVSLRWQFKYDGAHEITEMTDGRGGKTINEYNGSHQVVSQKDPAEHTLTFEYEAFRTKITNKATGSVTDERFTSSDEPFSITHGYGAPSATTESFTYNEGGYVTSVTDGDGHTTTYGYSGANDRTSAVDPNKNETKWTYDSTHDVETVTTPKGETTTIKREAHGNPETISRPAPGKTTQTTTCKYAVHGELESVEDPLKRVWRYGYDSKGNRTSETNPEGNMRTWEYDEDSQEAATIGPRGNVPGSKPAEFTTKIERDSQGRPLKITDPLTHTTKYTYDGDGNVETTTDGNARKTTYTYNADNQPIKVKEPNGTVTETEYDGAGQVIGQTDGTKNTTKYVRNAVEEVTEVKDPLGRTTTKEYDAAGNLKTLTDPAKRTTTYAYDPANRLTEVSYSDGKTPTVKYEYDTDGDRTKIVDGTGTTTYTYDELDRLTEGKDGHGNVAKYEYDLANQQTKITYPNGKSVTRAYDKAGRLEKVTDWSSNATKFTYDLDSNQASTIFPVESKDEDKYTYNNADQMSEVKMLKSTETLASLIYTRDGDGQVKSTTAKGLSGPGLETTEDTYDENNRLTKAGATEYKYDAANNTTKIAASAYEYDKASELKAGPSLTYTYDELGQRTKTTPSSGPATAYGYDQAGNLTSVTRPKEGATPEIKDTYTYDGNGLRASQTIAGTTSYLAWDMTESLPLILNDGTNNYIYGPSGLPVEQISSGGTITYLHHDQQGSTRLITGTTGTVTGTTTYDAYGNKTGSTGTSTTPLGYDGQYANSDTGLIYMRARVYDPATAQFLSVDPLKTMTRLPYAYAVDNPLNLNDPSGLIFGIPGTPSWSQVGTRFVGFWDGFTRPLAGGTAGLRGALGLNDGLETCSIEYKEASNIGELDASIEAGAALGGGSEVLLDRALGGLPRLGPVVSPLAAGVLGGAAQHAVAGESITPATAGQGAVGGLAGELATGLVPGTSAAGAAGAVNAALGLLW
jgi:RHS repeat-associated protein